MEVYRAKALFIFFTSLLGEKTEENETLQS